MDRSFCEALARRWASEGVAAGNLQVFDELLAPDVLDLSAPPGAAGLASFKERASLVAQAFSDREVTVDDLLLDGDRIAWRWTLRGTHAGIFSGVPPTGKRVELRGVNLQRLRGGQVVEHWTLADMAGALRQLRA